MRGRVLLVLPHKCVTDACEGKRKGGQPELYIVLHYDEDTAEFGRGIEQITSTHCGLEQRNT
jgi:hypothetical protein